MGNYHFRISMVTLISCAVFSSGCELMTKLSNLKGQLCDTGTVSAAAARQPASVSIKLAVLEHAKLSQAGLKDACNDGARYSCMKKVFSPELASQNNSNVECSHVDTMGAPCLNVNSIVFNTKDAAAGASADALEQGGIYNYVEYSCFNQAVSDGKSYPAAGVQLESLDKALEAAQKKCLAISEENG